jgi:hypothetical protein
MEVTNSSALGVVWEKNLDMEGGPELVCRRCPGKLDVELLLERFPVETLANPADKGVALFFLASVFFWNNYPMNFIELNSPCIL